ncbi:MAG: hybrid sensor histidine kinase/response regulator [Methylotenera sp.]|nr:hybrid sensor histidine kinase/response regulator [Methylotenera sp.]
MLNQFLRFKTTDESIIQLDKISITGRAQLLDLAYARLRFSLFAMPFASATFACYYHNFSNGYRVIIWSFCYCCAAIAMFFINKAYKSNQKTQAAEYMLNIWLPRIQLVAVLHGISFSSLLLIVGDTATLEFKYLFILTLAAVIAANATHQSPTLSVFARFLIFGWFSTVVFMPFSLPDWKVVTTFSTFYGITMYWHALKSHRFFLRMVWLEEEGARLAASYKLTKESVEGALKAKNQFLTTASHDLRQPVHAMGFLIESIARRNQDVSLIPALKDLKQSVRSVTQMFNSLLDLSKIEAGAVEIHLEPLSLDRLMNEIAATFREEAFSRNLKLHIHHKKAEAFVLADATLLRQSMANLMHNALRYTIKGGVLIAVRKRGNFWQFEVWDTGVGVAMEDQDRIYSPFFRNEHAWRIDSAGHGLGLAVVARCAELMKATYGFTSNEGRGSRFWLSLPVASAMEVGVPISNAYKQIITSVTLASLSGRCLIIDDDPQVCVAWESILSAWGLQVKCVASGLEAMAVLKTDFKPQAIFCDQRLRAGESGFDVLRGLLDCCPEAHGAMISGEFDSPELKQAESEGYLVLHKPLEPEVLHDVLSRWLMKN